MKPQSPKTGTKFVFLIFALLGALIFTACTSTPTPTFIPISPVDTINLILRIEDENRYPISNAQVRLDLPDRLSEMKITDAEGNCVFVVEKNYLNAPAEIRVKIPGNPQIYVKNINVTLHSQTLQIQTGGGDVAPPSVSTSTAQSPEITPTVPSTVTKTKTLTPVPTATIHPSYTPTSTPILPTSTPDVSAFTPYPASKDIISPNTKNDLWQLATWRAESPVYSLSISPDGKWAASGEQNGNVIVYDISTGTSLYTLNYGSAVLAVAFSPDGQWLATAGSGRNILAWNTKSWNGPVEIGQHNGKVTSLSFSPDGTLLASSGYEDKAVKLWQVGAWTLSQTVSVPEKVNAVVFSPDSRLIAVAANDIYPRVWDRNGVFQYALMNNVGPRQLITSLAFSPDSSVLVTGTRDLERCLQIWDTQTHRLKRGIGGSLQIEAIAFSPDGELLVTSNDKFELTVWRASNMSELRTLENYHQDLIYSIVFSPDGKLMLTASRDKTIRVWGIR